MIKFLMTMLLATASLPGLAALQIFATVPEWGALAREIGGDKVSVFTATTALQDPHRIQARPSLLAQARRADLVVATGADLEVGWLPLVLRDSGNANIQPGRPGYFEAARFVTMLAVPLVLDRSQGDMHAAGNPHVQLDPRNLFRIGEALALRLGEIDPPNAQAYLEIPDFSAYLWNFVDGRPVHNRIRSMSEIPAKTPVAEKMSKDLQKRGFRFVGPTIVYAFMQACGLVNDHLVDCHRHEAVKRLGRRP